MKKIHSGYLALVVAVSFVLTACTPTTTEAEVINPTENTDETEGEKDTETKDSSTTDSQKEPESTKKTDDPNETDDSETEEETSTDITDNEQSETTDNSDDKTSDDTITQDSSVFKIYQAEDADYDTLTTGSDSVTYVYMQDDGTISFTISAENETTAYLKIKSKGSGGTKKNTLYLNDTKLGDLESTSDWRDGWNSFITLQEGENTIKIEKSWGWTYFDYIELVNPEEIEMIGFENFVTSPCNAKATNEAKALMTEIAANYGSKIITGQMDLTWKDSIDMDARVYSDTGKHPKLMGYDFMNYLEDSGDGLEQVEEAIAWHKAGGYVAFCWHWRVTGPNGYNSFSTYTDTTTDGTDFAIPYSNGSWDTTSEYYTQLINDIDAIAEQLKVLQTAGVPVLWRPLHEAAGNIYLYDDGKAWFWWGNSGAEAYIALWQLMYDRMTNYHELNNLLWVWNGQSKYFYPGDEYVDFIGQDIYQSDKHDYSSQYAKFIEAVNYSDSPTTAPKMVALTENGAIPSPKKCYTEHAMWAWFMTWNDGNSEDGLDADDNFWTGNTWNTDKHKTEVYTSPYVITRQQRNHLRSAGVFLHHRRGSPSDFFGTVGVIMCLLRAGI